MKPRTININSRASVLFAVLLIAGLTSCDDKIRSLEDLSQPPSFLYFKKQSTNWTVSEPGLVLTDSAKVWTATNNASFPLLIKLVAPQNNLAELSITGSEPQSSMFVNDNLYTNSYSISSNVDLNLAFRSPIASTQDFVVKTTEIFDKSEKLTCRIIFKSNRPPKSVLKVVLVDGQNKNYQLDASSSYDIDQAIGGNVVQYEYVVDNVIINTSEPKINHVFTIGTHSIKLRVKDNDDVWSDYISQSLTVN